MSDPPDAPSRTADAVWGFRPAPPDGGRDFGNANVWSFKPDVDTFVREVLQNALDAAVRPGRRVDVTFRLVRLTGDDLADYLDALRWAELGKHLTASTRNKQKLGALLRDGLDHLEQTGELLLLAVQDANTTGLPGAEKGEGKFAALCRNNLDSNKDDSATKGGAFGLGKGVLWRASRFATVLFCSDLHRPSEDQGDGRLRLIGRSDLPWHELPDGRGFAGPGWFGASSPKHANDAVSFWGQEDLAARLYLDRVRSDGKPAGSGTSACVVGFHDPSSDETRPSLQGLTDQISRAAAAHFFPAISADLLAVSAEAFEGRAAYRSQTPEYRNGANVEERRREFVDALAAFQEDDVRQPSEASAASPGDVVAARVKLHVPAAKAGTPGAKQPGGDREHEHEAVLLVRFAAEDDDSATMNRVAMFRGPGMVVKEQSLRGVCLGARPFHGLLLCGKFHAQDAAAEAADEFLRTAEPPSHDQWTKTAELKAAYAHGCITRLSEFEQAWKDTLREIVKPGGMDLGDGPQSLRDLFKIGREKPAPREKPYVQKVDGRIEGEGADAAWVIRATVRLKKPSATPTRVIPEVQFAAETGGGTRVRWASLKGVKDCTGGAKEGLLIPANKRSAVFEGRTDPQRHPVPAAECCIRVDVARSWSEKADTVLFDSVDD